jgi:hypothetical protein
VRDFDRKFDLAGCNPQSEIYNLRFFTGVLAQLVERLNGIEEVTGSNPVGSTTFFSNRAGVFHDGFMTNSAMWINRDLPFPALFQNGR